MPLTVPNIIRSYARGGGSIAFTLDIEPSAVDTWTTKRYATASIELDGDAYDDATLGGLAKIGFEAKVIQGGNVATLPAVEVKLLNKEKMIKAAIRNPKSPIRLVMKAFFPARALPIPSLPLSYQKPIRRYEQRPTPSHPTNSIR